jgi:hypothetical protein
MGANSPLTWVEFFNKEIKITQEGQHSFKAAWSMLTCFTGLNNVIDFSVYFATLGKGHYAGLIFLSSAFHIE